MFKSKPVGASQNPPSSYESSKNSEKSMLSQTGTSRILPPRPQTLLLNSKIPKPILKKTGSTPNSNSSFNSRIKPPQITTNHPQNIKEPLGSQDSPRKLYFQNDLPSRNNNSSEIQLTVPTIPIGTPIITTRDKLTGILRFMGLTHFKEGLWAGIELDLENTGKNDGSVSGKRYFNCPPNKGIFIDARAIRARGRLTSINKDFPENNSQVQDKTFEKVSSNSNSKSDLLNSTNNLFKTKLTNGTINESVLSSLPGLKTLSKKPSFQRISLPPKTVTENKEKSEILDRRISQPAPIKEEFKGLESDLAVYLSSEGANPTLIIQNLLSQLNSCQKQNELLQVRINRKRAQQEATRVLRNEMLDRSRQDRSNRRTSLNTSTSTIVPETPNPTSKNQTINNSKNKDGNLIDVKVFQSPTEIPSSKETNEQFMEKDDGTVPPSSPKKSDQKLQDLQAEFIDLQAKIASKDETITELRGELLRVRSSSRMGRRRSEDPGATERLKSLSEELESLKQDAAEEVSALQAQIGELKRQLNDDSRSANPGAYSDQVEELKSKLNETIKRSKNLEKEKAEMISNSQIEIQHLKQQLNQRSEAYSQLLQRLPTPDSNIASLELEIQGEREASQALIDQLVTDNEALQTKVRDLANNSSTFEDGISWRQYEELKEEKESYLASVESLQREREDFLSQIQDLKAALQNDGSIPNINPRSAGTLTQDISQLEERIRELEDELISAQSFSEKYQAGSLTSEDIHQNLIKELDKRHNNIVNLEARARGAEERGHQLAESNKQLISEIQALEEDNWGMSDMIRDLQEETAQLTNQVNNSDNKIKQLDAALEATSSNSSTARHLQKVLFQMEEIETSHQADSEYLYSMINDQDEELARLADRELELQEHIEMLESELESIKNQEFLSQYPESEDIHEPEFKRLSLDTADYCHHCYESGHSMDQCPLTLEEFPESYLASSEVDYSPNLGVSLSAMHLLS